MTLTQIHWPLNSASHWQILPGLVSLIFPNKFFFFFLELTPISNEQELLDEYAKYEYKSESENPV